MKVKEYVLKSLQKKSSIDSSVDVAALDYVEEGYVDSLGMIQFIVELEEEFGIEFTDEELASSSFRIVGELIKLVESKVSVHEES